MKKTIVVAFVAAAILLPTFLVSKNATADTYIREIGKNETYHFWFKTGSTVVYESITWVGAKRLSVSEPGKRMIFDLEANRFVFINTKDKTYVEMNLPLNLDEVLSAELKAQFDRQRQGGTVTPARKTREILDIVCEEYEIESWDMVNGSPVNQRTMTVWATTNVLFDTELYYRFLLALRMTNGRSETQREELEKILGLQMGLKMSRGGLMSEERFVTEVVEMSEKKPPFDAYEIPAGYTRKEQLTTDDIQ